MKIPLSFLFLTLVTCDALACDFSLGAGPTFRAVFNGGDTSTEGGNVISAQCLFDKKWLLQTDYFTEQKLFNNQLIVNPYAALSVLRRWSVSRESTRLPPFFQFGLTFKEAQSCNTSSRDEIAKIDCNPLMPSPVSFTFGAGFTSKRLEFVLRHTSNAGLSKPNGGQDSLVVFYRF